MKTIDSKTTVYNIITISYTVSKCIKKKKERYWSNIKRSAILLSVAKI